MTPNCSGNCGAKLSSPYKFCVLSCTTFATVLRGTSSCSEPVTNCGYRRSAVRLYCALVGTACYSLLFVQHLHKEVQGLLVSRDFAAHALLVCLQEGRRLVHSFYPRSLRYPLMETTDLFEGGTLADVIIAAITSVSIPA